MSQNLRTVFAEKLRSLAKIDDRICVVVGDIGHATFAAFREEFPQRYFNIGILEQAMVSVGAGLSAVGLKPILHTIAPFMLERAYESLKLDFSYQKLSGVILTVGGTFDYSNLGCTHHCYHDIAIAKSLDNCEMYYPGSATELETHLEIALSNELLSIIRVPARTHHYQFNETELRSKNTLHVSDGLDLTIVVCGPLLDMVDRTFESYRGKSADIFYVHKVKPFDVTGIYESAVKTGRVIVVEEHSSNGGITEDVMKGLIGIPSLMFEQLSLGPGYVREYGTYEDLLVHSGLTSERLLDAVANMFKGVK